MKLFSKKVLFLSAYLGMAGMTLCSYRLPNYSSHTATLATHEGEGRFHKKVLFNSDVTISSANALAIVTPDSLVVHAEQTDQVTITAPAITGITDAKFPTLTTTLTPGIVEIDGSVVINGNLTINTDAPLAPTAGGTLVINGDLIVKGAVTIEPLCTLEVRGDVIIDGDGTNAVIMLGILNVKGLDNTLANGSTRREGNVTIRNCYSNLYDGTTYAPIELGAAVSFEGVVNVDGSFIAENNKGDFDAVDNSTMSGVYFFNSTITIGKNAIFRNNIGGQTGSGAVTIAGITSTITVQDIIFEKNKGAVGQATANGGAGAVAVRVAGSMTAFGSVVFHDNTGGNGSDIDNTLGFGAPGNVAITFNANIQAQQDFIVINNQGGSAGLTPANSIGGDAGSGVVLTGDLIATQVIIKNNTAGTAGNGNGTNLDGGFGAPGVDVQNLNLLAHGSIVMTGNIGGAGGDSTGTGIAGNGGDGINIAVGVFIADEALIARNNVGGAGGAGGSGGAGGNGFELAAAQTITVYSHTLFLNNSGGAGTPAGVAELINGTINVPQVVDETKVIYTDPTSTSALTGPINKNVFVLADFTVDSNFVINGNLFVKGAVTIQSGFTLTVNGDVLFDGQSGDKQVIIAGTLQACNVMIVNYASTLDHAVDIATTGVVIAKNDITIKNNSTTAAASNGVIIQGDLSATSGTILVRENSSTTDHGVEISGTSAINAVHIVFNTNSSTQAASHGVYINEATVQAQSDMRYVYNFGGATSGNGVLIGDVTATTIRAATLYVVVDCASQRQHFVIGAQTTKEDFYGATLQEFISNAGSLCTVDTTP